MIYKIQSLFLGIIIFGFSHSQVFSDYLYVDYESLSTAGSVVTNKGGGSSVYNNPSGLAEVTSVKINGGYSNLYSLSFFPYTHISIIMPTKYGNYGISYHGISVKYRGNKLISERSLGISQGTFLQKDRHSSFAIGYRINYLSVDQGETKLGEKLGSSTSIGIDFGILGTYGDRYRMGAFLKNINNAIISGIYLPRRLEIGLGYSPYYGVMTSFNISRLFGANSTQYMSGINYKINSRFSFSTGFQSNPNRVGLGCEIKFTKIQIQYALLTHHVLPITQQFSFGWSFD